MVSTFVRDTGSRKYIFSSITYHNDSFETPKIEREGVQRSSDQPQKIS